MRRSLRTVGAAALAIGSLGLGGCTQIEEAMATVPFLNFMYESPAFDPYESPRPEPTNSVPLESPGDRWEPQIEATEANLREWGDPLTNPLPMEEAVLERGAVSYQINCAVCHGVGGAGDGPVVGQGKLPFATNLLLQTSMDRSDGYLYAIIRLGRGLMPSYRRIQPADRWAIVNYVRYLQEGNDPIPVDVVGGVQPRVDQFNTVPPQGGDMNTGEN